jgi:MFS family permease
MIKDPFANISKGEAPRFIGDEESQYGNDTHYYEESHCDNYTENVPVLSSSNTAMVSPAILSVSPMSIGDVFGHIITLYSEHGSVLIKSMTILNLPVIVGSLVIVALAMFPVGAMAGPFLQICLYPLQAIGAAAAAAVIAKVVSDSFLGKEVDLWESLDYLWQKAGTVFSAALAASVSVFLMTLGIGTAALLVGFLAGLLAGLLGIETLGVIGMVLTALAAALTILLASFSMLFSPVVAIIEDKSWFDAPRRSIELVTKTPYAAARLVLIATLVWLSTWFIGVAVTIPLGLGAHLLAAATGITTFGILTQTLLGLASTVLLGPAAAATAVLLYYDHKIRYENFSLDELRKTKELL